MIKKKKKKQEKSNITQRRKELGSLWNGRSEILKRNTFYLASESIPFQRKICSFSVLDSFNTVYVSKVCQNKEIREIINKQPFALLKL